MDVNGSPRQHGRVGGIFCILSAVGFGAMAVFGKLAYDDGVSVGDLLLARFGIAAAVLVTIVGWRGGFRGLAPRAAVAALAMGAFGYAAQSAAFFAALDRIDASLLTLILYIYPVTVMVGAVVLGREHASARRVMALVLALGGIVLVLAGASTGQFDWQGAGLGVVAALVYTVYILVGDRLLVGVPVLPLSALVCLGAAATYTVATVLRGGPSFGFGVAGWGWLTALALVSTVAAILLFFAGLARVGPSVAAILSVFEPIVTIAAAAVVMGESLTRTQLFGGVLVLAAVVVVQWPTATAPQHVDDESAEPVPGPGPSLPVPVAALD